MASSSGDNQPRQKLLVPTNFSAKSELALDFALKYSQTTNANIYLFHVFEDSTKDYRRLDRLNEEYMDRMKQVVIMAIDRLTAQGVSHSVEDVHRRISHGKPWLEILRMAAGVSADMIIMGHTQSADFKRLLMQSPCTVVLVREKDAEFVI